MTKRIICSGLVLAGLLAGCGSSADSNDAKIAAAQGNESSAAAVHSTLTRALGLHHYAGVDDVFQSGTELCDIDDIVTGPDVPMYKDDSNALASPDGKTVVEVGNFQGTAMSDCMSQVQMALGW